MARRIIDSNPDPSALLDELFHEAARDFKGLTLGDVAGHARARYEAVFAVLCLTRMLADIGRLTPQVAVAPRPGGALWQDKQTSYEFPAAHALPAELLFASGGGPGRLLPELLHNGFSRVWLHRNVFGRTDRVHRLVNVADRNCERGPAGFIAAFADACEEIANLGARPQAIFRDRITPAFTATAQRVRQGMEAAMSAYERSEAWRGHPVDRFGKPLSPRPRDVRVGSPDAEARAAAKIAMLQILDVYADAAIAGECDFNRIAGQIEALRHNETVA